MVLSQDFQSIINETNDVTRLHYINFNTNNPGIYLNHCNNTYKLWKSQWQNTFSELGVEKKLFSDDFLNRQVCGVFSNEEPIGFILYNILDLKLSSAVDSFYFHNYTEDLVNYQILKKDKALVISYMTLNPKWRKQNTNYSISELLISFVVLELNFSDAQRVIGYFRNNRSTNEIFYRHAGKFLQKQSAYNVDVDFAEIHLGESHLSTQKDHAVLACKMWTSFKNEKTINPYKENTYGFKNSDQQRKNELISQFFSKPRLEQQEFLF